MLTKQVNGGELNIAGTDHLAQSLYRELETFTKIKLNKKPCSDTGGNWSRRSPSLPRAAGCFGN